MNMAPYLQPFYSSRAWRDCRDAYARSVGGLCERCRAKGLITPGTEVHHKVSTWRWRGATWSCCAKDATTKSIAKRNGAGVATNRDG